MTQLTLSLQSPFPIADLAWAEWPMPGPAPDPHPRSLSARNATLGGFSIDLPDSLADAVPKRQREFLAGRLCAAAALRQLGLPETVGRNGRAPVWPAGATGSISHSRARAMAVASRLHDQLGLDCEILMTDAAAHPLAATILHDAERTFHPEAMPFGSFLTLVFSAKEAFYKSVSATVGRILSFHEVELIAFQPDLLHLQFEGTVAPVHWRLQPTDCVTLCARLRR